MEDYFANKGRHQIPTFGNWEYYDDIPVTQYFESARQAGLVRGGGFGAARYHPADADLFHAAPSPMPYHYRHKNLKAAHKPKHHHMQANVTSSREQRRQVRVCDADAAAAAAAYPRQKPKAVDEDLYKIPPELLCKRRPKNVAMGGFWRSCLCLNGNA